MSERYQIARNWMRREGWLVPTEEEVSDEVLFWLMVEYMRMAFGVPKDGCDGNELPKRNFLSNPDLQSCQISHGARSTLSVRDLALGRGAQREERQGYREERQGQREERQGQREERQGHGEEERQISHEPDHDLARSCQCEISCEIWQD